VLAMLFVSALGLVAPDWRAAQCQGEQVAGRYTNFAEGFSVQVPNAYVGRRGVQSGPERGVSIALASNCEAFIVLYGEPNSLEWKSPEEGLQRLVTDATEADASVRSRNHVARLGRLTAAGVTMSQSGSDQIEETVMAFRPHGSPVYTATLVSSKGRYRQDKATLEQVLSTFRLERWR
jgi:hypothetical protein